MRGCVSSGRIDDPSFELIGYLKEKSAKVVFSAIDQSIYQLFDMDLWFENGRLRIENFGEQIIWEKLNINTLGERVVKPEKLELPEKNKSEMQNAYEHISHYLFTKQLGYLENASIEAVKPIMEMLWQADNIYHKYKFKDEIRSKQT